MKISLKAVYNMMKFIKSIKFDYSLINLRRIYHFVASSVMLLFVLTAYNNTNSKNIFSPNVNKSSVSIMNEPNYMETLKPYRDALSQIESVESYDSRRIAKKDKKTGKVIYSQYWGKYQIGRDERIALGLGDVSWEIFSKNKELQDAACNMFIAITRDRLMNHINKDGSKRDFLTEYNGKVISHHYLTESGMVAMAHNSGVTGLKKFLSTRGKHKPVDGLNTSSLAYLTLANYNVTIPINSAKRDLERIKDSIDIK